MTNLREFVIRPCLVEREGVAIELRAVLGLLDPTPLVRHALQPD
jgi:hypothetical protein